MRRDAQTALPLFLRVAIVVGCVSAVAGMAGAVFLHREVDKRPPDSLNDRPSAYIRVVWAGDAPPDWLNTIQLEAQWTTADGTRGSETGARLGDGLKHTYGFAKAPMGIPLTLVMKAEGRATQEKRFRLQPFHTLVWRLRE